MNWEELAERGEELQAERAAADEWYAHLIEQNSQLILDEPSPTHQMEAAENQIKNLS